ncbi:TetR family transcriptional regulator, partial [Streptomyces sp. NPDC059002]|uniref:TetR family transcriptional regulator n=1 Tax=Streptomyces sp. NPDC059002 TaxID=3346690 RepID=UPI00367A1AC0
MTQQERARRTRQRILDLTAESFAAQGFTRTNLKEVAKNLGMTTGALYGHFANKEAIADALEREAAERWALLRGAAEAPHLPPGRALDSAVLGLVKALADPRMRAAVRLASDGAPREHAVRNLLDAVEEFLLEELRGTCHGDDDPAPTWRPEPTTRILLGLICGTVFARHGATDEESQSGWEEAARVLLGAVRERAPGGGLPGGALPDRALPDGALPDGALPDGALPDGGLPDGGLPGGALPDGELPDRALPDGGLPDGALPGRTLPDGGLPGGALPDRALPDGGLPDGALPGRTLPDGGLPG